MLAEQKHVNVFEQPQEKLTLTLTTVPWEAGERRRQIEPIHREHLSGQFVEERGGTRVDRKLPFTEKVYREWL